MVYKIFLVLVATCLIWLVPILPYTPVAPTISAFFLFLKYSMISIHKAFLCQ